MLLPESVLLGLFPQGLILSKPASWEGGDDGIFTVDVSCLVCYRGQCTDHFCFDPIAVILTIAFLPALLAHAHPRSDALARCPLLSCSRYATHNVVSSFTLRIRPHRTFTPFTSQFDADCFQYILDFWAKAQYDFYGTKSSPGLFAAQANIPLNPADTTQNPLFLTKQAIIVLREELEYFSITKPGGLARTDIITGLPNEELREVKRQCGKALEERTSIFTALQRNVNKENNLAEQHLIDMLCMRWVAVSFAFAISHFGVVL